MAVVKKESKGYGYNYASLSDIIKQGHNMPKMYTATEGDGRDFLYFYDEELKQWLRGAQIVIPDSKGMNKAQLYDAYFTMNKAEWLNQENQEYRTATEKRFKQYYVTFKEYYEAITPQMKAQIVMGIKNRMFAEGLLMESITFDDWIKHVMEEF